MRTTRARSLLIALWAGSLWTVGYLVAPTLFATLSDRVLAGTIAGAMFRSEAWLSLICGLLLLVLLRMGADLDGKQRRSMTIIALAMVACTLVSHLGITPFMTALREAAGPGGVMASGDKTRFGILHGVSSLIYLGQSVLAGLLIWKHQ
jgi:hypothetical protein